MYKMAEIYKPAIVIDLRDFRKHPVEWYQTWNVKENEGHGLYDVEQELKRVCNYKWGNSCTRLMHMAGGNTFVYAMDQGYKRNEPTGMYNFMVWDDVRGDIVNEYFRPDKDGLIPQELINKIDKILTRWTRGYTDCRECGSEMKWLNNFGMYYDSRYCSQECADKNKRNEIDRSK